MALVSVFNKDGKVTGHLHTPSVIRNAPIRPDIIHFVHTNLAKNHRQAYARYNLAGHQHSAESWGTGRAVARVPRISGSGTSRNGQAAFANSARGGRMFSPLKVWRRWHRLVNVSQKRFAVSSAIAASSVPALVLAHGHKINRIAEIPLVVSDEIEKIEKTKDAVAVLKTLHITDDVNKSANSRKIRAGKGKARNRRYVQERGVLIIHDQKKGLSHAFRNISGVDIANVNRLNLLSLAPGGHPGRFVVWTEGAFKKLDQLYGTKNQDARLKKGYRHPTSEMTTTDLYRIIHSPEVQSHVKPANIYRKVDRAPKIRRSLLLTRKIRKYGKLKTEAAKEKAKELKKEREEKKKSLPRQKPEKRIKKEKKPVTAKQKKALADKPKRVQRHEKVTKKIRERIEKRKKLAAEKAAEAKEKIAANTKKNKEKKAAKEAAKNKKAPKKSDAPGGKAQKKEKVPKKQEK